MYFTHHGSYGDLSELAGVNLREECLAGMFADHANDPIPYCRELEAHFGTPVFQEVVQAHQRLIGEYFTKLWTHQGEGVDTTRELRTALVVLETLGNFLALGILAVMEHKAFDLPNLPAMAQITAQYKSSKKMFKTLEFNFPSGKELWPDGSIFPLR